MWQMLKKMRMRMGRNRRTDVSKTGTEGVGEEFLHGSRTNGEVEGAGEINSLMNSFCPLDKQLCSTAMRVLSGTGTAKSPLKKNWR